MHTQPGGQPPVRPPWIRVDARGGGVYDRTSPRMRFDPLQLVAWTVGLWLVTSGVVGLARIGVDDIGWFEPRAEVAGAAVSPLLAGLLVLLGLLLLVLATGEVDDRGLRLLGAGCATAGLVWLIEPGAFEPYLATERTHGVRALVAGGSVAAASFLPPISIRRPGTGG